MYPYMFFHFLLFKLASTIASSKLITGRENAITISAVTFPEKPISWQRRSTNEIAENVVSINPAQDNKENPSEKL